MQKASVWAEKVMIPTYEIGEAEKNPIFLEKRVYQGSCGKVYPYPTIEKISERRRIRNIRQYGWKMSTLGLWFFQSLADESRGHMIKQMIMTLFTITR